MSLGVASMVVSDIALSGAASRGYESVVRILVESGASLEASDQVFFQSGRREA